MNNVINKNSFFTYKVWDLITFSVIFVGQIIFFVYFYPKNTI